jgi:hypothetical protein
MSVVSLTGHAQTPSPADPYLLHQRDGNLYREVLEHKDQLSWQFHEEDTLPNDLCRLLVTTCPVQNLPFKIFGFPLEAPERTDPGTLVLSWTADHNQPDIVMLASATREKASFFLLSPEGKLLRAASKTKNGTWSSVANDTVQDQFERASTVWRRWLASLGPSRSGATP